VSELIDTIDRGDVQHMREELGDVLIQIVFHAQIEAEAGRFDFDDVARDINEKLVRRHPHVFGEARVGSSAEVLVEWEKIKAQERKAGPAPRVGAVFKELPPRLPALMFAEAVCRQLDQKKLPADGVVDRPAVARRAEGLDAEQLGRQLFELVAAARARGLDPEGALRRHTDAVMAAVEARVAAPA
jgi:XTP/dITP diphosphohydrolase/tetrapyrrole methylase family protein/MazG family protein